jgi:hypothetical protein
MNVANNSPAGPSRRRCQMVDQSSNQMPSILALHYWRCRSPSKGRHHNTVITSSWSWSWQFLVAVVALSHDEMQIPGLNPSGQAACQSSSGC